MNLGLGNLITLKSQILTPDLVSKTEWDTKIEAIGLGVAAAFNSYCNRDFERSATAIDQFDAERSSWVLRRYPVEAISAVDSRNDLIGDWATSGAVTQAIQNWSSKSGLVHFGFVQGIALSRVRISYAGGYWFDTSEDATGIMPAGATLLPRDITLAWLLQCQHVWEKNDVLAKDFVGSGKNELVGLSLAGLDLVPQVKQTLAQYIRYQIT